MNPAILNSLQIFIALLLIGAVLLQQRGTGLGGAFGGASTVYRSKRGVEKLLYNSTIILALLFVATAIANFLIR